MNGPLPKNRIQARARATQTWRPAPRVSPKEIADTIIKRYFSSLFTDDNPVLPSIPSLPNNNNDNNYAPRSISDLDNLSLCKPVLDAEIELAVFQLGPCKPAGPDGFSAFAVIARVPSGKVREINYGRINLGSALAAEAWTIRVACSMAGSLQIPQAIFETYCSRLVKLLSNDSASICLAEKGQRRGKEQKDRVRGCGRRGGRRRRRKEKMISFTVWKALQVVLCGDPESVSVLAADVEASEKGIALGYRKILSHVAHASQRISPTFRRGVPPPNGSFKANCDKAMLASGSVAAIAVLLQDCKGNWIDGSASFCRATSIFQAEVLAIRRACILVKAANLPKH
ncbi:hypothetical protein RHMOL_Rhmol09G0015100 [Rhododendron molle]|uniref:Uncharacterized protein n=1 Tax=Rhododendron molle TaxID=49168 RepID=A0ACC0M8L9_RHOML|nr:hypothetical protein RHMOL_Rhmol09G0015100 [Rhododendron molle]